MITSVLNAVSRAGPSITRTKTGAAARASRAASARTASSATSGWRATSSARGSSTGSDDDALTCPSPRAANARLYMPALRVSAVSAAAARGSSARPSAYATGHHSDTGRPSGVSTIEASASYAFRRANAYSPRRTASASGASGYVSSSGVIARSTPASTCGRIIAAMSAACAFAPIAPSASAARPCTSGDASFNAATRAAVAASRPISPRANAAICRTSGSASVDSTRVSGRMPSTNPTRPTANAARRRTRGSPCVSAATRSGTGGAAGPAAGPRRLRGALAASGGEAGASSRRMRWSSSRMIQASDCSNVVDGGPVARGGADAHPYARKPIARIESEIVRVTAVSVSPRGGWRATRFPRRRAAARGSGMFPIPRGRMIARG